MIYGFIDFMNGERYRSFHDFKSMHLAIEWAKGMKSVYGRHVRNAGVSTVGTHLVTA